MVNWSISIYIKLVQQDCRCELYDIRSAKYLERRRSPTPPLDSQQTTRAAAKSERHTAAVLDMWETLKVKLVAKSENWAWRWWTPNKYWVEVIQIADYGDTNILLWVLFGDFGFNSENLFVAFFDLIAQLAALTRQSSSPCTGTERIHVPQNDLILSSAENLNKEPSD